MQVEKTSICNLNIVYKVLYLHTVCIQAWSMFNNDT